jgi:glycosyltransferase involved in cell wall biosynthesis
VLTVSVVIPVYRAALTLRRLYSQLSITMRQIAPTLEIIFVEDCGGDESWSIITELAATDQRVRGIRAARYDVIVTMDDALQRLVGEIAPLLRRLGPGVDVVYGTPQKMQHGFLCLVGSRLHEIVREMVPSLGASVRVRGVDRIVESSTLIKRTSVAGTDNPPIDVETTDRLGKEGLRLVITVG